MKMLKIELEPSLSSCVETLAKRAYREAASELLGREDRELKERVELLRAFLEKMDFRELRKMSEKHLVEGKAVKFIIYMEEGVPNYSMEVE